MTTPSAKSVSPHSNIDADRFRIGMRQLAGAVNIIATRLGDRRRGLTATAVCSFSVDPARLLACVNVRGETFPMLAESRCMSVNVLGIDQEELARCFAGMLGDKGENLFKYGDWTELETGAPVLRNALASFDCTIDEMLVAHTHAILVGEVKDVLLGDPRGPLIYADRAFTTTVNPQTFLSPEWISDPWV
jgi:flavin reductase (DIM6/NTAB) family NADH-FMN oxidoreductase RutF